MWTNESRGRYDRSRLRYPSDLTDEEWALVKPLIPPARRGGKSCAPLGHLMRFVSLRDPSVTRRPPPKWHPGRSAPKRELQEHEDRIVAIEAIAIEVKAIIHDGDNDETSSAEDPDADKRAYASVFRLGRTVKLAARPKRYLRQSITSSIFSSHAPRP